MTDEGAYQPGGVLAAGVSRSSVVVLGWVM